MGLRGAGAMSLFRPPPGPHVHVKYRLTCRKCGRFFVAKRYRCDVLQRRRLHAGELPTAESKQANLNGTGRA